jgi:hypothetical protein
MRIVSRLSRYMPSSFAMKGFLNWSGLLCLRDGAPPWREQWRQRIVNEVIQLDAVASLGRFGRRLDL